MITFYFDENVSPRLVEILRKGGAPGSFMDAVGSKMTGMRDPDWLQKINELGWIVISSDRNEQTRGISAEEVAATGIVYLMLGEFFDHLKIWEKTKWVVAHWDAIYRQAQGLTSGSVQLILKSGEFKSVA